MVAIIPTEIGMTTLRTEIHEKANVEVVTKDLDMTDKLREDVAVSIASYQYRLINLYNMWVKLHTFLDGDLVLIRVFENMTNPIDEKF